MPWFEGSCLLNYLESVHIGNDQNLTEMRFAVQYVIRPTLDFRGYAGQVTSGVIRKGDPIMVLPSGRTSRIASIVTYDGDMPRAFAPMSVTVCLEDEIDISRGDMLVPPQNPPHVSRRFEASLVWMNQAPQNAVKRDRKSTRLNSSHVAISYAVFCLKKKIPTFREASGPGNA